MAQVGTFTRDESGNLAGTIRTLTSEASASCPSALCGAKTPRNARNPGTPGRRLRITPRYA